MTAVSKNMYIDKLDEVVKKFKNRYHRTIKMKPVDSRSDTYIEYGVEHNDQDLKFKVSNFVRISKQKDSFAKGYNLNWPEEVLRKSLWLTT